MKRTPLQFLLKNCHIACRKYKRGTANAIAFEIDYESNLVTLCEEINNGTYQPGKSIAFIVNVPVKREIFAADFRDRVAHHLIVNKMNLLFEKLKIFINGRYKEQDKDLILELCRKVIFYDPAEKCIIKGKRKNWQGLPPDKSIFYSPVNCGLPIGNLTSRVFANFYMNSLDHFIKHELKFRFYGRYVDDFIF